MDKVHDSIKSINTGTLQGTKDSLKSLYEIISTVDINDLLNLQTQTPQSNYLIQLLITTKYIYTNNYTMAYNTAINIINNIQYNNTITILDSLLSIIYTTIRISTNMLNINILQEYLISLSKLKEYNCTDTITVVINSILIYLDNNNMYDEAYIFIRGIDESYMNKSSVYNYYASKVYFICGEYKLSYYYINKAIINSTDSVYTDKCTDLLYIISIYNNNYIMYSDNVYNSIYRAVKSGDIDKYNSIVEYNISKISKDKLYGVVSGLECVVYKERVRRICNIYSRISISTVSTILGVSKESVMYIISDIISDGSITGSIIRDEYISEDKVITRDCLNTEDMLSVSHTLTMIKKHVPVHKKTIEEMQMDMAYNEYRI
ncbi:26S proteasome regulatory subunit N3 [Nematocida parisii]|uniref:PCI domain-containing protein n=1 Tax=Nematocida parisii (strain ERTm3) TaxID=935791 RepID=I3EDM7_NEMP3|nr:uncharacterized protein NEPG_01541 [Nematocida parisii ERTm1]EIJ87324.1 hypothetical protein NEQG_02447 [Nematocida parisii ERTm3]KAI5129213.1 26S proteasome regulatory subunit N3 [Nematocida parisii]EIJ93969.1 hypothetical protein NEPG_01541 [Nematocida parisii ERTm1]KAI5130178.1 26S proteasome regulatory subunit N3 [Nematocida parisii]KAI5143745.1 26S proteasome regulatory subunit N3 [Nematocida parisii]|eukprot:XP_013059369.1 hypothetical protein NEPG_01541 [Nematocida parisii ERTm1]